jgi:AmpD protein
VAVKEALGRNQWASTEQGVPAGYKPPQEAAVDTPSVSFSKTAEGKTRDIRTIVMHSGDGTREGDINNLTQGNVSAHYYVNRDGTVQHFVPENDVAYHAGKNIDDSRYSNQVTLGIEQEHVDGKQDWPDAQVRGAAKLVSQIMERHPGLTIDDVVGHSTIAPERKQDPLDYPWDNFKKYVQEDLKGTPGATVAKTEEQPEETRTAAAKEPEEKEPVEEVAQAQPRKQLPKIATPTYQRPQTQAVLAKMIKEKSPVKSSEELPAFA